MTGSGATVDRAAGAERRGWRGRLRAFRDIYEGLYIAPYRSAIHRDYLRQHDLFMLLGFSPELIQGVFRIGDSSTNLISPMMSFFALIVAFVQRYDSKAGIGTVIATMLPYSVAFLVGWMVLLVVWMLLGLPLGPGAALYL